jgi:hypothetical protein
MAATFWSKQGVLQAGLLLGCVTLNTAAGLLILHGHRSAAVFVASIPTALGVSAIIATNKMVARESEIERETFTGERKAKIPKVAFARIVAGVSLALGILGTTHDAKSTLTQLAHSVICGQATLQTLNRPGNVSGQGLR